MWGRMWKEQVLCGGAKIIISFVVLYIIKFEIPTRQRVMLLNKKLTIQVWNLGGWFRLKVEFGSVHEQMALKEMGLIV